MGKGNLRQILVLSLHLHLPNSGNAILVINPLPLKGSDEFAVNICKLTSYLVSAN